MGVSSEGVGLFSLGLSDVCRLMWTSAGIGLPSSTSLTISILKHANKQNMTSVDFARAQQQVLARQQQRINQSRALAESNRRRFNASRIPRGRLYGAWHSLTSSRPAFRVGQLDSELLDDELLELLKARFKEGLKYFGVRRLPFYAGSLIILSRISSKTGPPKFRYSSAPYSSNSRYGIKTLPTARLCRA